MATTTTHTLPPPFVSHNTLPHELTLITQGAEALIYRTHFLQSSSPTSNLVALKYRPKKSYRHPALDTKLTKARILSEARVMVRLRKEGVGVPGVMGMSWEEGWLAIEWIEGGSVRGVLDWWFRVREEEGKGGIDEEKGVEGEDKDVVKEKGDTEDAIWGLMRKIGRAVGRMHEVGVTHGDLTTSNLMVKIPPSPEEVTVVDDNTQPPLVEQPQQDPNSSHVPQTFASSILSGDIILIDFGLSVQTVQDEDRAVDLYVLERAFGSTHPQAGGLFKEVLVAYGQSFKGALVVLKRLEEVRLRGRKKSMIG